MKEITEMIAQALVDRPEFVNVDSMDGKSISILRLRVGLGDTCKIIGRKGRTAEALRTILKAIAAKERKRVILEIEDESHPSSMFGSKMAAVALHSGERKTPARLLRKRK